MRSIASSVIAFGCVFGGAMLGMVLGTNLAPSHIAPESKETVRLAIGLVATMATFVLGLLVASSKATYDVNNAEITEMASQIILLDRLLANFGPDAQPVREMLRGGLIDRINHLWPKEKSRSPAGAISGIGEDLYLLVAELSPTNERQKLIREIALATITSVGRTRWLFFVQGANSVPIALVVIMISWLTVVFISFGVFAPRTWTATGSMFIAAVSVSAALFLILEMYAPLTGLVRIRSASVRSALAQLGR